MKILSIYRPMWPFKTEIVVTPSTLGVFEAAKIPCPVKGSISNWVHTKIGYGRYAVDIPRSINHLHVGMEISLQELVGFNKNKTLFPFDTGYKIYTVDDPFQKPAAVV